MNLSVCLWLVPQSAVLVPQASNDEVHDRIMMKCQERLCRIKKCECKSKAFIVCTKVLMWGIMHTFMVSFRNCTKPSFS